MSKIHVRTAVVLMFVAGILLGGCANWKGDKDVETEPPSESTKGPGLFTGKDGGIIIFQR